MCCCRHVYASKKRIRRQERARVSKSQLILVYVTMLNQSTYEQLPNENDHYLVLLVLQSEEQGKHDLNMSYLP